MNSLRDAMSHAALGWVKPELDEILRQARNEIEYFVEEPGDAGRMRFCAGYLHQVQGTLRMLELYAPAMVAEELERLAVAVGEGGVADPQEACATLMRGTVLLPDYLERLQNGHRDIPIVLLPLLNEIRAARAAEGVSEGVLLAFDPEAGKASEAELEHARGSLAGRNRELLDTVGNAVKEELLRIKDALDLHVRMGGQAAELQAQVNELGAVADTLGMMGLDVARGMVARQHEALRDVVAGNRAIDDNLLLDIAGALLYVDASLDDQVAYLGATLDGDEDPASVEIRRTVEVLANEAIGNFAAAREAFVAFIETNWDHQRLRDVPRLLDEVAGALRMLDLQPPADYMEGVRQYIDVELIGRRRIPGGRQLDTLADAMASLEYYLEALRERRPGREEILDITRSSLEALRYWPLPAVEPVERAVTAAAPVPEAPAAAVEPPAVAVEPPAIVDPLPAAVEAPPPRAAAPLLFAAAIHARPAPSDTPPVFDPVVAERPAEAAPALDVTVSRSVSTETAGSLGDVTADAGAAAAAGSGDTGGMFDPIAAEWPAPVAADDAPPVFEVDQVPPPAAPPLPVEPTVDEPWLSWTPPEPDTPPQGSAGTDVPVPPPAGIAALLHDNALPSVPAEDAAGTHAGSDAMGLPPPAGSDPEAQAAEQEMAAFMADLDKAAAAFDPFAPPAVPAAAAPPAPVQAQEPDQEPDQEPAQEPLQAPAAASPAASEGVEGGFDEDADQIDEDIREVFIEEFDEELLNLGQLLPAWRAAPDDLERLRPLRRVFHTLKGSGRLVGARALGEFSWKIEGMLNRVLDGSRRASPAVVAMVEQAFEVLPQFNAALRDGGRIHADVLGMQAVADRVGAGEEAFHVATAAATEVAGPAATSGTPAAVDSVLREILEAEVRQHLATMEGWLSHARQGPQPVDEALLRAVHTMSGAFAMTEVPEITAVTAQAESFAKRLLANGRLATAEGVAALDEAARAIAITMQALQAPSPLIPPFAALAARLQALADALPEAQWPPLVIEDEGESLEIADDEPPSVEAPVAVPVAEELGSINDLSAYFDPSLLDASFGEGMSVPPTAGAPDAGAPSLDDHALPPEAPSVAAAGGEAEPEAPGPLDLVLDDDAPLSLEGVEEIEDAPAGAWTLEPADAPAGELLLDAVPPAGGDEAGGFGDTLDWAVESDGEPAPFAAAPDAPPAVTGEVVHGSSSPEPWADVAVPVSADMPVEGGDAPGLADQARDVQAAPAIAAPVAVALDAGPLGFDDLGTELVDIFVEEGKDLLDHCDRLISGLRSAPGDRGLLGGLQRDLHTLKGGARMAGINAIGDLGHAIESLLEAVAGNRTELERGDVQLLERGFDHLHQLLLQTGAHRSVPMPVDLIEAFEQRTGGQGDARPVARDGDGNDALSLMPFVPTYREPESVDDGAGMAEAPEAPVPVDAASSVADDAGAAMLAMEPAAAAPGFDPAEAGPQAAAGSVPASADPQPDPAAAGGVAEPPAIVETAVAWRAPAATPVPPVQDLRPVEPLSEPVEEEAAADTGAVAGTREQVRVRADLLDRLVNHAGEVAIYRSRLEQQLGAFRSAMAELDRTNARLRDQLRRLDLETEAQIVARYRREQEQADHAFDPLELDRFSTLQQLSRALNESAADLGGLQGVLDDLARNYDGLLQQQSRVSSELQDGLMRARMVPFDGLVPRLRRVVRQAAQDSGKQVHLELEGTHGELDRNVLDRMVAPLEHMLRNSVAHGLETPAQRLAAGKPEEGRITLRLRREGSEVVLEVSDDGVGLDREAIRRRGEQRGLIREGDALDDAQLDNLIFASGFSTSEQVSQLAGRGVGMDVVRNEVRQLGGSVDIHSVRGSGARFTLRLPQTLAVTQAVFVRIGDTTFAVPVASVSGIGRIARERFESGQGGYHYNGEDFALHDLGTLVGQAAAKAEGQPQVPLLLVRAGDLRVAVAIDQVLGNREIVVKPVGLQIASVPGIYGATITGEGNVVVILDIAPLVRRHLAQPQAQVVDVPASDQHHTPLVMVVDDSLTMRKVTGRVLERHNFEVVAARDGVEALERLEERVPDLMLLDIEMPRMDGYELATAMRADPRYKDVPIVMITSRSGDKHRQRAFEIGVQRYLGKPYQELDLMRNVYDLLGIARVRE